MAKPDNLPSFPGWRPIGEHEPMGAEDVLICHVMTNWYEASYRHPSTARKANPSRTGISWGDAIQKNLNPDFYPYRKATYEGMPEGIKAPDGWVPLPDNEPMQEGDKWVYSPPCSLLEPVTSGVIGKTPTQWKKDKNIGTYAAWPYRQSAAFGKPSAYVKPPRLPPNPAKLTQPLPLP